MIKLYKDFSVMKGAVRISMLLIVLTCIVGLSSCGDDDDKKKKTPKNQITVDGKTFDFTKGYIVSEQISDGEEIVGSAHWVFLAGGDLELDDDLVLSGEGDFVAMYIGSEDENDLVADEYDMDYEEYDFGNVIYFDLYENYSFDDDIEDFVFDAWYSGNDDGTVTIATPDDNNHIFTIDLEEYYFLGDSEDETTEDLISEALTGYFKGDLVEIEASEGSRKKLSNQLSNLRKSRRAN